MLIKLEIENFRSYKNKIVFHTLQRNFKRFSDHIYKFNNDLSILKTSGIYGANGSGKTNLFKALYYVKKMVENADFLNSIESQKNFTPFKLNEKNIEEPCVICVDFIADNTIYVYSISVQVSLKKILNESLSKIIDEKEIIIFNRDVNSLNFPNNEKLNQYNDIFSTILLPHSSLLSKEVNDSDIKIATNWFKTKIEFLFPTYEFDDIAYIFTIKREYLGLANQIIKSSNVGIDKLELTYFPIELYLGLENKDLINFITNSLQDKTHYSFKDNLGNYCTAYKDIDDEIYIVKLMCIHYDDKQNPIPFDLDQESRGTIVLLHLLPALIRSYGEGINYFIDDINTSLHPILLKEILGQYLTYNLGEAKGQLIFNSHEDFLMDEKIVRQDELWLMEKNNGISEIFPLSDFPNVRFDLNLRKNYLNGKFGGVPFDSEPNKLKFGINE